MCIIFEKVWVINADLVKDKLSTSDNGENLAPTKGGFIILK